MADYSADEIIDNKYPPIQELPNYKRKQLFNIVLKTRNLLRSRSRSNFSSTFSSRF